MQLTDRCYAITGLGYLPPWTVNAGFIRGDEVTIIIDTGANGIAAATIHGYAAAVAPGNQMMVINTEQHFDHIGGNSYFADLGWPVYGHRDLERTEAEFAAECADYNAQIAQPARRSAKEADAFYARTRLHNPTKAILDEALFDPGRCQVEVLFTPGHTPTNISVWVPSEKVLYSGDCLIEGYLPNLDAGGPAEWKQWLASLKRIERLTPEVVVPGHGWPLKGSKVAEAITRVREMLETAIETGIRPTAG